MGNGGTLLAVSMHRGGTVLTNRLSRLMGERRLSIADVARGTGISYRALYDLYHAKSVQIHLDTLDKLCNYFHVGPEQIFEWEHSGGDSARDRPAKAT